MTAPESPLSFIDPTLTRQVAQSLILIAAELQGHLDEQAVGNIDAQVADMAVSDAENDLRRAGRLLAEVRKGTRAAWQAVVLPFPKGGAA